MKRGTVGLADRIALIALGGIVLSLVIWLAYAFVGGVLFNGVDLTTSLVTPSPEEAWNRLVAIVAVLIATLILQALTARKVQAEQALAVEQSRTRQMYENSPDGVVCMQGDRTVTYANLKAEALAGVGPGGLVGMRCHEAIFGLAAPCDRCGLDEILRTGQVLSRRDQVCANDGQERWLSRIAYPIRDAEGTIESVVEMVRDVTELHEAEEALRRSHLELEMRIEQRTAELQDANDQLQDEVAVRQRAEDALRESEQRYRRLIEHSPDMILVHHRDEVTFVNAAGLRLLGAESLDEALGSRVTSLWEPDGSGLTAAELSAAVRKGSARRPLSVKLRRLDGSLVDVEVTATPLMVDGEDYVQCVAHDITERLRAEETIKQMAFYDGLTGLPNRTLFRDRLVASIARAARSDSTIAVAFLDLDDFKAINDTLGHALGDELLAAVGSRLQGLLRENDTVARHSGDEFTVIAELKSDTDAARLAERISEGLRPVFHVAGHDLHVSASIGIALCPEHSTDEVELLKMADTAMYRAKEIGHSQFRLYDPGMSRAAHDRLELESELRRGIENSEFELFYQPQIDLRSGKARGVEALLRWRHPTRGLLSPDSFLEVAEQAGLVNHLGRWVMAEACSQAKAWEAQGVYVGVVAVNLSAREFMQRDVVQMVSETLAHTGLEAGRLEIEITENVAVHNLDHVLRTLGRLRELGVRIAIDDFGTGYSSMSYLQRFPIHTLKIAQTFMRSVGEDPQSAAIASMVVDLCRQLDLEIVAEGIETETQRDFLLDRGCIIAQGYLFCRPKAAPEVADYLRAGNYMGLTFSA